MLRLAACVPTPGFRFQPPLKLQPARLPKDILVTHYIIILHPLSLQSALLTAGARSCTAMGVGRLCSTWSYGVNEFDWRSYPLPFPTIFLKLSVV